MNVAEQYSTFVSAVKEQAIAEYVRTNGQARSRPSAPPRIGSAGGSLVGKSASGPNGNPRNLDEARSALFDYLKHNM